MVGLSDSAFPLIELLFIVPRVIYIVVGGGGGGGVGFLKDTMVSFTTIHGPLRRQAAVLPCVSCKRSTFVSPAFPDPKPVALSSGLRIIATSPPLFAMVT